MDDAFAITGQIYREPPGANRRTLRFELGSHRYYLKLHWGVGWREIMKNLVTLRLPVVGAANEWRAIIKLRELGVETMKLAAYGRAGWNPARQKSYVITHELKDCISLEDYCAEWKNNPPPYALKQKLISRIAETTRKLHQHGVNHRDLYICHFLLQLPWSGGEDDFHLYLIDLHRVQIRRRTPQRWKVKDVAALYFSAMHTGLTKRDLLRFMKVYSRKPIRQLLVEESGFWEAVERRALAWYADSP